MPAPPLTSALSSALRDLLAPALQDRAVLALNHVLQREPLAMQRLAAHRGRRMRIQAEQWPSVLPDPGTVVLQVTPPGLVERIEEPAGTADLTVRIDAGNPARLVWRGLVAGERPAMAIDGDVRFAGDVDWIAQNLRWDAADDLQRILGAGPAAAVQRFGRALADAIRTRVAGRGPDRPSPPPGA